MTTQARAVRRSRRRGGAAFFRCAERSGAARGDAAKFVWSQACTGKFVWPIADRGFKNHIHRVAAPTLIVWGTADGIIAPAYAQEFGKFIDGSRIELINGAGHLPHLENLPSVGEKVGDFLAGQDDTTLKRSIQRQGR